MRGRHSVYCVLLILTSAILIAGDLPSCSRARCSHCQVQFIAQMCPQACVHCPPLRSVDDDTGRRAAAAAAAAGSFTGSRNAGAATQSARAAHGRPTAVGVPLQTGAQQPQQPALAAIPPPQQQAQFGAAGSQTNVQPSQQYQFAASVQQPQPQQPAYPQVQLPQVPSQSQAPSNVGPYNFYQTSSNVANAPSPQQFYQTQGQQTPLVQTPFAGQNYAVPSQPQLPTFPSQQQPAQSSAFNPFQPFLQHSLQAQTPFNPFTFPTPAPSLALFTPPSLSHTFNPFTLPPPAAPAAPQLPAYTASPPPAAPPVPQPSPVPPPPPVQPPQFPVYQQQVQQGVQPTYSASQSTGAIPPPPPPPPVLRGDGSGYQTPNYQQAGVPPTEAQRPRQLYYSEQQSQQGLQELPTPQERAAYAQPSATQQQTLARPVPSARVSTTGSVVPSATSIDSPSAYIVKNAYAEKQGPYGGTGTCPKQPNWEPCIAKDLANERFRNCCQRLGDGCSQLCSYDSSLTTIQLAVLTGRCPIGKVADMMICASGYEDATPCCEAHGVFEPGFEHCRPYCNPAAGLPNDGMLAEKYRCLGKLSQIQRCFYVTQRP